jgi:hypothetical protein
MAYISFPLSYKRQFAQPLDIDSVFSDTQDRLDYLTNPLRYAGQIVADTEAGKVYMLNAARTAWTEIGPGAGGAGTVTKAVSTIGNGSDASLTMTHNLNSSSLNINVWDNVTGELVFVAAQMLTVNAVRLDFNTAPALNRYKVVILS